MAESEQEGATGQARSALRRKAVAGRPAGEGAGLRPERAVRMALARAGQGVPGLDLRITELTDGRHVLAELLDMIPDHALLAMLEGPAEGLGLVAVAPPVLSGIVEVQTTGRLAKDERPPRKPTRTDAAMTVGLVDQALTELNEELADTSDIVWAGGFHFASFLDDPRPLGLLLEDIAYRVFTVTVTLGDGGRNGAILLALPAEGRGAVPAQAASASAEPDERAHKEWTRALEDAVMAAEAEVSAVLHRLRVPLSAVMQLAEGDMIPVPAEQLERIELEAIDGRRLGAGRLGQNRGMRAVRLTLTPQSRGSGTAMDMPGASMDAAPLVAPEAGGGLPSLGLGEADPLPEPGLLLPLPGDDGGALPMAMPMGDGLGDDMGGLQIDGLGEGLDLPLPEPMGIALPDPLDPLDDPLVDLPPMAKAAGAS
jgi:flagellar motor switch protein FliM